MTEPLLLTSSQACKALHVSPATLRRWAASGRIRAMATAGGHRRYPLSEIQRLRRHEVEFALVDDLAPPPDHPLPQVAALLERDGPRLLLAATAQAAVHAAGLSSARGRRCVEVWAGSCRAGRYEAARAAYLETLRETVLEGASFVSCMRVFYLLGRLIGDALATECAPDQQQGWQDLHAHLQEAAIDAFVVPPQPDEPRLRWQSAWRLIELSAAPMVVLEAGAEILAANGAIQRLLAREESELVGHDAIATLVPPRLRRRVQQAVNRLPSEGLLAQAGQTRSLTILTAKGDELAVDITFDRVPAIAGDAVLALVSDRSADHAEQLRLSRFEAIVEHLEQAIYIVLPDRTVCAWNDAAHRLLGYSAGELVGQPVQVLVPPEHRDQFGQLYRTAMSGRPVRGIETQRLRKDGHLISVVIDLLPLESDGGVDAVAVVARPPSGPGP